MPSFVSPFECSQCNSEQPHHLKYVGNVLAQVTCQTCGKMFAPSSELLVKDYARDLESRLVHKPERMLRQVTRHPKEFLLQLPLKVATKPVRMAWEFEEVARAGAGWYASRARLLLRKHLTH
jgi:hypothetical protein